jgi:hypothetical protein
VGVDQSEESNKPPIIQERISWGEGPFRHRKGKLRKLISRRESNKTLISWEGISSSRRRV